MGLNLKMSSNQEPVTPEDIARLKADADEYNKIRHLITGMINDYNMRYTANNQTREAYRQALDRFHHTATQYVAAISKIVAG